MRASLAWILSTRGTRSEVCMLCTSDDVRLHQHNHVPAVALPILNSFIACAGDLSCQDARCSRRHSRHAAGALQACARAVASVRSLIDTTQLSSCHAIFTWQHAAVQDEGGSLQGLGDHLAAKHSQERRRAQLGGGDWGNRDTAAVSDLLYKCAPQQDLL